MNENQENNMIEMRALHVPTALQDDLDLALNVVRACLTSSDVICSEVRRLAGAAIPDIAAGPSLFQLCVSAGVLLVQVARKLDQEPA